MLLSEDEKICPFMSRPVPTDTAPEKYWRFAEVKCLGERCAAWTTMDGGYCFRIWDVEE